MNFKIVHEKAILFIFSVDLILSILYEHIEKLVRRAVRRSKRR